MHKRALTALALAITWTLAVSFAQSPPATAPATTPATSAPVKILLLHVNDSHGQISGTAAVGGYARLATLVEQLRAEQVERVFLTDSGDILSRGDALTRQTLGAANFELMKRLKFDAWTPGNGDFYDGLGVLGARIKQAGFPTLASNVTLKDTGQCLARPYVIAKAGGVRVAMFGLCTVHMIPPLEKQLSVEEPIATARRLVPELRKQADLVVAVTHIGYGEDVRLAEAVAGIDVILGGHTHTHLPAGRLVKGPDGGETLIGQAGEHLDHLGVVRLTMAPREGGYVRESFSARTIALDARVKMDPQIKAMIARLAEAATQPTETAPAAAP